jgi:8-oxo-dGTP pyrophosphatase MutT (NUDIX family)
MTELDNVKVSATVIVISRDNKALIVQRPSDKAFPNLWTVAGGKLQEEDGNLRSEGFRYDSVEACARRELQEETGIGTDLVWIDKLKYLCSITTIWGETRRVILSFYVVLDKDAKDVKITLSECQAYRWIEDYMIDWYGFIPDIGGEIKQVFQILKKERDADIERIIMGH